MHLSSSDGLHKAYPFWHKVIFWGISFALYCLLGLYGCMHAPGPFSHTSKIKVSKKQSVTSIIDHLHHLRLVRSKLLFRLYLIYTHKDRSLKKGHYVFEPYTSQAGIADAIFKGLGIYYSIFIPEGYTNLRIFELIRQYDFFEKDDVIMPEEGLLFPDTYRVEGGTSYTSFINTMSVKMRKNLEDVWRTRAKDLYFQTARDVLIVASIIEKETTVFHERHMIAGVIMNRLKKGMRLQVDPTTIYGISKLGIINRALTLRDLKQKTPFNTYVLPGLPPTPISNPGRLSLKAATHPALSNYLFHVATGTGGHYFAETHEQHLRNIALFRKAQQQRKESRRLF